MKKNKWWLGGCRLERFTARDILMLFVCFFSNTAFAFLCPTNFNQIDFGMTPEQVTQACGNPDVKKEYVKPNDNIPQEWSYFVPQTVNMGGTMQSAQGTLKTSMVFDDKGKAVNISVNGIGVGSTTICNNNPIQLGDDRDKVEQACGKPAFVNKQTAAANSGVPESAKMMDFIYSSITPPVTLVFVDGKLSEKK